MTLLSYLYFDQESLLFVSGRITPTFPKVVQSFYVLTPEPMNLWVYLVKRALQVWLNLGLWDGEIILDIWVSSLWTQEFLKVGGRRTSKGYVTLQKRLEDVMWEELSLSLMDLKMEKGGYAGKVMEMDSSLEPTERNAALPIPCP